MQDRLFRVIVLGGIGLVGAACGDDVLVDSHASSGAVSGAGGAATSAASGGQGGFPEEGPVMAQSTATVGAGGSDAGCFPDETAVNYCDAGPVDSGFPQESDPAPDAAQAKDGGAPDAGFPQEAP